MAERILWVFDQTNRKARLLAEGSFVQTLEVSLEARGAELKDIRHGGFRTIPEAQLTEFDLVFLAGVEYLPMWSNRDNALTRFSVNSDLVDNCNKKGLILRLNSYCILEVVKNPYPNRE